MGRAQFRGTQDTYAMLKAGPNYYLNGKEGGLGGGIEICYGKWLINTVSMRARFSGQYVNKDESGMILYLNADALFDILASLRGYKVSDYRTYALCGVGLAHCLWGDNDFNVELGIGGDKSIHEHWRLSCEIRLLIHPSDFDNNSVSSLLPSIMMGVVRDINANPTRTRLRGETRRFSNDWFFQVAIGVSSLNYRGLNGLRERLSLLTPIVEYGLGKDLSKAWSGRFFISGLYGKSREELFSYYNLRADMLLDLAGLLNPEDDRPLLDMKAYSGVSFLARLDDQSHFILGTAMGLILLIRPSDSHEFYIDGRYLLIPPRFARVRESQGPMSVGMGTISVGYSYFFTRSSF